MEIGAQSSSQVSIDPPDVACAVSMQQSMRMENNFGELAEDFAKQQITK